MSEYHRCVACGTSTPEGKDLCWCCEHAPKLHPMESTTGCGKDMCKIYFKQKAGDSIGRKTES